MIVVEAVRDMVEVGTGEEDLDELLQLPPEQQ